MSLPNLQNYHKKSYEAISPIRPELRQTDKTVLVTGGSSGIGLAIAQGYLAAGAALVIVLGRRPEVLQSAIAGLNQEARMNAYPGRAEDLVCDVYDPGSIDKLWQAISARQILVGTLVLNASEPTGECAVKEGLLYYRERLWIPGHEPLTTGVIQKVHDSFLGGHPGRDTTIDLLARQFYWPGMNQDVRRFLRNCDVCGRTTIWRDKKKGMLKPLLVPSRIWQEISMDFITDLPPAEGTKATILLVITDRLSKGTILLPVLPGQFDTESVAHLFIERYVPYY